LQAIATARRLGAVVSGFDVRPAVREQVESLGATFLDSASRARRPKGLRTRADARAAAAQQTELQARIPAFDVVITTAAVPGRQAPKLISAEAVRGMRDGSVIVDLAAETGGNCELTQPGEEIVAEGVTIVGTTNVPSLMATHASQLLSRNMASCSSCWCTTASSCSTGTTRSSRAPASRARR
jgi:NAD/NADP transhydrogenase alpha subunit